MAIAIVHYHLRRGGVTRVIEAQSAALRLAGIDHVILSGTEYTGEADLPVVVLPALDYHEHDETPTLRGTGLAKLVRKTAAATLGCPVESWHIHNPTLGKNHSFPEFIEELCDSKERLVLQFHDFAEDGRPRNYQRLAELTQLYPIAPQIRYAFINSRDRELLVEAGVPVENTALLPNAVTPPEMPRPISRDPDAPAIVVYPVRGIRRKNLGEICLLAGLAPSGTRFAVTLAPENPQWKDVHDDWVRFAEEHRLHVQFGAVGSFQPAVGVDPTFPNWLAHATHLITTSIAEGFGMSFLEPIALGKPLLGRDLPEITRDFKRDDIALGNLYDHLLIPLAWIDRSRLVNELERSLQETYAHYREDMSPTAAKKTESGLLRDGYIDFGALPEPLQREAATRAFSEPGEVLIEIQGNRQPAADWLAMALRTTEPASPPSALDRCSVPRYADMLAALYRDLQDAKTKSPKWLDKSRILHQFLKPERFHFLRT